MTTSHDIQRTQVVAQENPPEVLGDFVSKAGTRVVHTRVSEQSTTAMARHISVDLSRQKGETTILQTGNQWLTFTGADQELRARQLSAAINKGYIPSNAKFMGYGAVVVSGSSSANQAEQVPSSTIVIGHESTIGGEVVTQEQVNQTVDLLLGAAQLSAERDMP